MTDVRQHLRTSYGGLLVAVGEVDEQASWAPTGCTGWAVRDLVHHCWSDAQRALVALHTPARADDVDLDAVGYWVDWGSGDPQAAAAGAASGRRFTRVAASMFLRWEQLRDEYVATVKACLHAAADADGRAAVATQGHALRVDDLMSTLAVEATLHHLDLVAHLDAVAGPGDADLAATRSVLDAVATRVAGVPFPAGWSDRAVLLVGTGREPLDLSLTEDLGPLADRVPLFS